MYKMHTYTEYSEDATNTRQAVSPGDQNQSGASEVKDHLHRVCDWSRINALLTCTATAFHHTAPL